MKNDRFIFACLDLWEWLSDSWLKSEDPAERSELSRKLDYWFFLLPYAMVFCCGLIAVLCFQALEEL